MVFKCEILSRKDNKKKYVSDAEFKLFGKLRQRFFGGRLVGAFHGIAEPEGDLFAIDQDGGAVQMAVLILLPAVLERDVVVVALHPDHQLALVVVIRLI